MANAEKGEVDLTLAGRVLTFKLGTGALIELQELVSKQEGTLVTVDRIIADAGRWRLSAVRAVLWAGLRKYHAEYTLTDVEDLLDEATPEEIRALLGGMGQSTLPDPKDLETLGVTGAPRRPRPRTARAMTAGTGEGSTSTPADVV